MTSKRLLDWTGVTIYYVALFGVHYLFPRSETLPVIVLYIAAFLPYFLWSFKRRLSVVEIMVLGTAARLLLFGGIPTLSDDFYRFYWDGALLNLGHNPFQFTPTDFLIDYPDAPIAAEAFTLMNSPKYYSVYPPTLQMVFFLSGLFGNTLFGFVLISRLCILVAELASARLILLLLRHFKKPDYLLSLYFLNPLIVLELTGNLHNEVFMITFTLLATWLFIKRKSELSAIALGFAVGAKLYPLLFAPLFALRLPLPRAAIYSAVFGATCMALFLPFGGWSELENVMESLRLYYQSFEFNGSIYAVGRYIGYQLTGYNLIKHWGRALAALSIIGFVWMYFRKPNTRNNDRLAFDILFIVFIMYALSTSVMPWYLSLMIAACPFTRWRFPIVWSAMIPVTYAAYGNSAYQENYWLIGLEYVVLLAFVLFEYKKLARSTPHATA